MAFGPFFGGQMVSQAGSSFDVRWAGVHRECYLLSIGIPIRIPIPFILGDPFTTGPQTTNKPLVEGLLFRHVTRYIGFPERLVPNIWGTGIGINEGHWYQGGTVKSLRCWFCKMLYIPITCYGLVQPPTRWGSGWIRDPRVPPPTSRYLTNGGFPGSAMLQASFVVSGWMGFLSRFRHESYSVE